MKDKIIKVIETVSDKLIYDHAVISCDFNEVLAEEIEKLYSDEQFKELKK
jgi:hypothetical protein